MLKKRVCLYQVISSKGGDRGPRIFFPMFNKRYYTKSLNREDYYDLLYIVKTDNIELIKGRCRNKELDTNNIIFLKERNHRFKDIHECIDLIWVLISRRIKLVTFITFNSWDPDPKLFYIQKIKNFLGIKYTHLVTNNAHAQAYYNNYEGRFTKYKTLHDRFEKVKWDGIITWHAETKLLNEQTNIFGKVKEFCIIDSNFCDDEFFFPEPKQRIIYWAGAFVEYKRPLMFVEAIKMLKDNAVDGLETWKFKMIGRGEMDKELQEYVENNGLSDLVDIIDFHTDYYKITNVSMAHVSTQELEHFSNLVINEAMSSGCAVIATNIGRVGLVVKDGKTGFLGEDNHVGIYSAMKKFILLSDEERNEMMNQSRELQRREFSDEPYINTFNGFWTRVLESPSK